MPFKWDSVCHLLGNKIVSQQDYKDLCNIVADSHRVRSVCVLKSKGNVQGDAPVMCPWIFSTVIGVCSRVTSALLLPDSRGLKELLLPLFHSHSHHLLRFFHVSVFSFFFCLILSLVFSSRALSHYCGWDYCKKKSCLLPVTRNGRVLQSVRSKGQKR